MAITQHIKSAHYLLKSNLSLITFDLDETVWPSKQVLKKAEQAQFNWLQLQADRLAAAHDIESLRAHRRLTKKQYTEIAHDMTAVRKTSLSLLLQEFNYPISLAHEAVTVFLQARNQVTPYPDVVPVLKKLAKIYPLTSITNGNADVQYTPLKTYFHFSLTPAIVGTAKPSPDIFHRALNQAGVEPHQAIHIGDHPECDVMAAQQVGMQAIWVNRSGVHWPVDLPPPDATIQDFYELEHFLSQTLKANL